MESLDSNPPSEGEGDESVVEDLGSRGNGKEDSAKQGELLMQSLTKFLNKADTQANSQVGETLALCQTMMRELRDERSEGGKRKVEEEKMKEEEFQLVELSGLTYKDDQNTTLDWPMRRLIKPIAADPEEYWKPTSENKETYPRVCKPALGTNWYLDHVMMSEVAASTILAASDSGTFLELEKYLARNSACMRQASKKFRVVVNENESALDFSKTWEQGETLHECVEGILNWMALEQVMRPHSYAGVVVVRAFHEIR